METSIVTYAHYSQVIITVCKKQKDLPMTSATSQCVRTIGILMLGQETGRTESNLRNIRNASLGANLD